MSDFPRSVPMTGRVRVCLEMVKGLNLINKTVVDIGSSFGWMEKEIGRMGAKEIVGVEPSFEAVKFARKNVKGASFLVGSALKLPVISSFADLVLLFDVIEHVPRGSEKQVLKEISRILKKGGILLLSTPNQHVLANLLDIAWYFGHRHYGLSNIKFLLEQTGFEVMEINVRGSLFSSIYLFWFYLAKRLFGTNQPRSSFLEQLDDRGYDSGHLTDIFLVAKRV